MSRSGGIIGVADRGGWAVLVTVARDGTLLDRRRMELLDAGLPKLPHHDGQGLQLDEALSNHPVNNSRLVLALIVVPAWRLPS